MNASVRGELKQWADWLAEYPPDSVERQRLAEVMQTYKAAYDQNRRLEADITNIRKTACELYAENRNLKQRIADLEKLQKQ